MNRQKVAAEVVGSSGEVGRPGLKHGLLTVLADPVADALDDMAALGLHWTRNRERGRMPNGIRAAMLMVAREVLAHVDMQERETQRMLAEACCDYPNCKCPLDAPADPNWCAKGLPQAPKKAPNAELTGDPLAGRQG